MNSNHQLVRTDIPCCTESIRKCQMKIAQNVFRYFHVERKLVVKLACRQTEIVTGINREIVDSAIQIFHKNRKFPSKVHTVQLPSGISLKTKLVQKQKPQEESTLDKLAKMRVPETSMVPVTIKQSTMNADVDEMIITPDLTHHFGAESALSGLKQIVRNLESRSASATAIHPQHPMTIIPRSKIGQMNCGSNPSINQLKSSFLMNQPTNLLTKKTDDNPAPSSKIGTIYIDVKSAQKSPCDLKPHIAHDKPISFIENVSYSPQHQISSNKQQASVRNAGIKKCVVLEPSIKWKEFTLINSMNFFPIDSCMNLYGVYIISQFRYIIHKFYAEYHKAPNISELLKSINSTIQLRIEHTEITIIERIIKECCGFFAQRSILEPILLERHKITDSRLKYLTKIQQYRKKNYTIIYTWIKIGYAKTILWKDIVDGLINTKRFTNLNNVMGNEIVALVQLAEESNGMMSSSFHTFKCKPPGVIDVREFDKWFETVIKSLVPLNKCVIVCTEHMPFYSKFGKYPDQSTWSISDQYEWLRERGVHSFKFTNEFLTNQIDFYRNYQEKFEKKVKLLFLPLHHTELNPIEYHWQYVKRKYQYMLPNKINEENIDKFKILKKCYELADLEDWQIYMKKVKVCEYFYSNTSKLLIDGTIQKNSLLHEMSLQMNSNEINRQFNLDTESEESSNQKTDQKRKLAKQNSGSLKKKIASEPITSGILIINNESKESENSNSMNSSGVFIISDSEPKQIEKKPEMTQIKQEFEDKSFFDEYMMQNSNEILSDFESIRMNQPIKQEQNEIINIIEPSSVNQINQIQIKQEIDKDEFNEGESH